MDVESALKSNATLPGSSTGSVIVKLHPLVVMNISDHWTRVKAQSGGPQIVYGALIGKQNGRVMEVMNSFELKIENIGDNQIIDQDYFKVRQDQFKQVFADIAFHGWYSIGGDVNENDVKIHNQFNHIVDNPIFLKLDPNASASAQNVRIYESVIDLEDGKAVTRLLPLNYSLITEEAERIGIDHVAQVTNVENDNSSSASEHLRRQHSSMVMLYTRVRFILAYLRAVRDGELPCDYPTLRSAHALCRRLPVLGGGALQHSLNQQYNDITLMLYLGIMNKGGQTMNSFINKFNRLYDHHRNRGRTSRLPSTYNPASFNL